MHERHATEVKGAGLGGKPHYLEPMSRLPGKTPSIPPNDEYGAAVDGRGSASQFRQYDLSEGGRKHSNSGVKSIAAPSAVDHSYGDAGSV